MVLDSEPLAGSLRGPVISVVARFVRYAAPEQLGKGNLDIRADLFTLGHMLIELLTGNPARPGNSEAVLASMSSERIDVSDVPGPSALRSVLAGLLAFDPDERFASPDDVSRGPSAATPEATQDVPS